MTSRETAASSPLLCTSLPLFHSPSLSPAYTKVFPTSYNHFSRNVPTVLSHSLLDVAYLGKILFAVSSREHSRARASPPHPFPGSSTQKNFNSAPEKSRMATRSFSVCTRIIYFKEPHVGNKIANKFPWRLALLGNYCLARETIRFGKTCSLASEKNCAIYENAFR